MKHLDLKYYWLRNAVESKVISVGYIPTAVMPADVLTKSLPGTVIENSRQLLGVV